MFFLSKPARDINFYFLFLLALINFLSNAKVDLQTPEGNHSRLKKKKKCVQQFVWGWTFATNSNKQEIERRGHWADLRHELSAKAALVVVPRWDSFHHSRHRVIGVTGPAPTWAHVQDLRQQFWIETKSASDEHCHVAKTAYHCNSVYF